MSPEERELLDRSVALTEENNKMLHGMKRSMFWSRVMSVIYWLFIIGISIGAFYFMQPYIDQITKLYGQASTVLKTVR
jgi:uncharacterized membrane protein